MHRFYQSKTGIDLIIEIEISLKSKKLLAHVQRKERRETIGSIHKSPISSNSQFSLDISQKIKKTVSNFLDGNSGVDNLIINLSNEEQKFSTTYNAPLKTARVLEIIDTDLVPLNSLMVSQTQKSCCVIL